MKKPTPLQQFELLKTELNNNRITITHKIIIIDTSKQLLYLYANQLLENVYSVSTSKFGNGSDDGSNKTPLGIHYVSEKIGNNVPLYTIFKSRIDTSIIWDIAHSIQDLILTRIIRLKGLQKGINKGVGIDSFERYIYIHGTNHEKEIGYPASHGCIRMRNSDIIKLYNAIPEGAIVFIVE